MQTAGDKPTIIEAVVCGVRARAAGHLAADLRERRPSGRMTQKQRVQSAFVST